MSWHDGNGRSKMPWDDGNQEDWDVLMRARKIRVS